MNLQARMTIAIYKKHDGTDEINVYNSAGEGFFGPCKSVAKAIEVVTNEKGEVKVRLTKENGELATIKEGKATAMVMEDEVDTTKVAKDIAAFLASGKSGAES